MRSVFFPDVVFRPLLDEATFYRGHSHVDENETGYFIELDAPGFRKEDLRISIENSSLLIEGERQGRSQVKLKRSFHLPDDVDVNAIAAQVKDGVLELALPKKEQAKPKTIPIQEAKESFFQKLLSEKKS